MASIEAINHQGAFMDPSSLIEMANDRNLSKEVKLEVVSSEFEKILIEQIVGDGMKAQFKDEGKHKDKSMQRMEEMFIPKLVAHGIGGESPFGLVEAFRETIK